MAVSKRLRHEVMRRDSHTCRYCGGTAPDVKLTIDHVTPTTLGGGDDPSNLVTACADCNAGKSATPPDAALVADVDQRAVQWGQAMTIAIERRAAELAGRRATTDPFDADWSRWTNGGGEVVPRDVNWRNSILRFLAAGLTDQFFADAIDTTMGQDRIITSDKWRYFCGICWREMDELQKIAREVADGRGDPEANAVTGSALPTPAPRGMSFDYMSMFDEFARLAVRALGGDSQIETQIVDRCLWDVMPEVHREMMERFSAGDEADEAVDHARGYLASFVQLPMAQVKSWRATGAGPLDIWATADDRWEAVDGHSNSLLMIIGSIAEQAAESYDLMQRAIGMGREVHGHFSKLCAGTVFESAEVDQCLLIEAFKQSLDESTLFIPKAGDDRGQE